MTVLFYFYDFNCGVIREKKKKKKKKKKKNKAQSALVVYFLFSVYFSLLAKRQKTQKCFVSCAFNDDDTPLVTNILCVCAFIETT